MPEPRSIPNQCEREQPRGVVIIVMARAPIPGLSKTRLIGDTVSAEAGAHIADAFLGCTISRISNALSGRMSRLILAITPDDQVGDTEARFAENVDVVIGQGEGDLGTRMARVWSFVRDSSSSVVTHAGPDSGVVEDQRVLFFGTDSPDLPGEFIVESAEVLLDEHGGTTGRCDVVIGPSRDGGYWTLGARGYHPELLAGMEWGTERVCDQTIARINELHLQAHVLEEWFDIDDHADLAALARRLARQTEPGDPALMSLDRVIKRFV